MAFFLGFRHGVNDRQQESGEALHRCSASQDVNALARPLGSFARKFSKASIFGCAVLTLSNVHLRPSLYSLTHYLCICINA